LRSADLSLLWQDLGLPGVVDVHVHILPPAVQRKVWAYFERAEQHYGLRWPIQYAWPLERLTHLRLVVAHAGMPQYGDFLDLAARFDDVLLDTTMAFTDFTERTMPFPRDRLPQLLSLGLAGRVVLGNDFPSIPYPYEHQLDALARLDLGAEWLQQVLWTAPRALLRVT
jgi:predicted TIM-barrel fold metal-dependent hydrolase